MMSATASLKLFFNLLRAGIDSHCKRMDLGATYLGSVADNILAVLREQELCGCLARWILLDEHFAYLHITSS